MKDTRTYCFGRFLIDLPKMAEVNGQAYEFMFGKVDSERFLGGEEGFAKKMKEREVELKKVNENDGQALKEVRHSSAKNMRLFRTAEKVFNNLNHGFEGYRLAGGFLFSMQKTSMREDKIDSVLQRLETRLLPNLRQRRAAGGGHAEEIPNEPGFCIENGFIADDGKTAQYEKAELNFKFKQWPDARVQVFYRTNSDKVKESLLVRRKEKPMPAIFAEVAKEIKTFRQGKHDVGPLLGEENLAALPTDDGYFVHRFVWDAQGKPNSATEPAFYLELHTGFIIGSNNPEVRPSLTDKQAIELFDAIVNSIRLRPTGPAKTSAADPAPDNDGTVERLPLGTKVSSAGNCPQSGIWQCAPDAPGITEHRRYLQQGQPMPYGQTQAPKRGLAGVLGVKEDQPVEIVWTLTSYADDVRNG